MLVMMMMMMMYTCIQEHFKCPYDERCRMDVCNRRFCKRCRLNKCFQIGMRKEYILTDEEKAQKRLKIEANRYRSDVKFSGRSVTRVQDQDYRIRSREQ